MTELLAPLDLTDACNASAGNVTTSEGWLWPAAGGEPEVTVLDALPAGKCRFWGIPFHLAEPGADAALVAVVRGVGDHIPESAVVAVAQKARWVIFAHVCAPVGGEGPTLEGAGEPIGTYRIVFEDGTTVEQGLRRRFEIHDAAIPWGHHPFLCRNCREFRSVPLGDRSLPYGRAQTAVTTEGGDDLHGWWLFAWENPAPDTAIERIEVVAAGPSPLALGAITVSQEEADPLAWPAREAVAVSLENDDGAPAEVDVERGVVVRQDDLFVPGRNFLNTDEAGWGRGEYQVRPGRYLEIHGSAHGRLRVRAGGDVEESFRWGDVLADKGAEQGKVRLEVVSPGAGSGFTCG